MNETKIAEINTLVRKNSRNELARMCKEKNLSCSGTKHDMAVRLVGGLGSGDSQPPPASVRKIIIRRNVFGVWEYDGLVFDDKTKNVIGCACADGSVRPLQRADIEKCRQHKFRCVLPNLLDDRPDAAHPTNHDSSSDEEDGSDDHDDDRDAVAGED